MRWKTKVPISKELKANFYPMIYFLRFFGIFPLKVEENESGLFLAWSPWYALYSYIFGVFSISSLLYGEISALLSKGEITMDIVTNTDILATWVVNIGYCVATIIGTFIIANKFSQVLHFIEFLNEVDCTIKAHSSINLNKKSSIFMPLFLFGTSATVYVASMYAYYIAIGNTIGLLNMVIRRYNPLIMNIYVGLMTQCMVRHLATCLENRFDWINEILLKECKKIKKGNRSASKNIIFIKRFDYEHNKFSTISISERKDTIIPQLYQAYLKLLRAADILNNLFGISIMFVVLAVFFGLVRTIYYIILLLQGKHHGFPEMLMRLSIFSHQFMRTLFITEPLYWCKKKMQATGKFVCDLLPLNIDINYRKQVNRFAISICLLERTFSAYGFFNINRFLITTLIESITTYVVILLQAAENDEQ